MRYRVELLGQEIKGIKEGLSVFEFSKMKKKFTKNFFETSKILDLTNVPLCLLFNFPKFQTDISFRVDMNVAKKMSVR